MELVCGQTIPDEQLAVLRRTHEVVRVRSPLHRIDLRQVALQRATDLQLIVLGDRRDVVRILLHCGFHSHKKTTQHITVNEQKRDDEGERAKQQTGGVLHGLPVGADLLLQFLHCATCLLHLVARVLGCLLLIVLRHGAQSKKENPTLFSANETQHPDCQ